LFAIYQFCFAIVKWPGPAAPAELNVLLIKHVPGSDLSLIVCMRAVLTCLLVILVVD